MVSSDSKLKSSIPLTLETVSTATAIILSLDTLQVNKSTSELHVYMCVWRERGEGREGEREGERERESTCSYAFMYNYVQV